ncbi:hypothetical protein ES705_14377 [subsurface metagenome]
MKKYSTLNNLSGWILFLIASFTYLSTIEPTASFWDCGEFIAASYKLQVGHPPGAPFFLLIGRIFTLFAGGNTEKVALMINALSALASAFTILFLFWTITHLVKKVISNEKDPDLADMIIILSSGIIGALVYTFSDTFWFSSAEGEVYASSSLFTAFVFWAILKWENIADEKFANRWLILIAYMMGLSVGVHLLNLLAIPAIVLIYYFRKYKVTVQGVIAALGISAIVLGGIMYVLIPGIVKFAAIVERLFVNGFGLSYFSGVYIYLVLLFSLLAFGIIRTTQKKKAILNTILLVITVITIGYSSYALVIIRSSANPPMDQNNPENLFNLLSYLNREQYGDRPLLYGQYFNAPGKKTGKGKPTYAPVDGRYEIINYKPNYKYNKSYKTILPRMYSSQPDHIDAYVRWTGMDQGELFEVRVNRSGEIVKDHYGNTVYDYSRPRKNPNFSDNIEFLFKYQLGHMYFRYFMWNFAGRQNDVQGHYKEEITKGNWISGYKFLDSARLGNQSNLTDKLLNNRARNKYYLLPLILGLLGLIFHYKQDQKNFWVVMSLFFFTGIAVNIYLNQYPLQPRERDYAYAGSFYSFSIWVGMAVAALYKAAKKSELNSLSRYAIRGSIILVVLAIFDFANNGMLTFTWTGVITLFIMLILLLIMKLLGVVIKNQRIAAAMVLIITLPVPFIMAVENWDDHNRSGRYVARDFASNYLNSCENNAILFTNGDNDTFPLWYAQEVEGIRTDVRVINLSYLSADWYIEQMERKVYDSEPVKMTLTKDKYQQGKRDLVILFDRVKGHVDLKEAIEFLAYDDSQPLSLPGIAEPSYYIPQHKFRITADSTLVFGNGTIKPEMAARYTPVMRWEISRNYLTKNHLMSLDFLATNQWQRPIYYAITVGDDNYVNLSDYFEMSGLAYRVIPAITTDNIGYAGGINTEVMFDNMMNKFKWGGIQDDRVYLDENCIRMLSNMRHNFSNLAEALILQDKNDSARMVLDKCMELVPNHRIPFDVYMLSMVDNYYKLNENSKAQALASQVLENTYQDLEYFISLEKPFSNYLQLERRFAAHVFRELINISRTHGDILFSAEIEQRLDSYGRTLNTIFR